MPVFFEIKSPFKDRLGQKGNIKLVFMLHTTQKSVENLKKLTFGEIVRIR